MIIWTIAILLLASTANAEMVCFDTSTLSVQLATGTVIPPVKSTNTKADIVKQRDNYRALWFDALFRNDSLLRENERVMAVNKACIEAVKQ